VIGITAGCLSTVGFPPFLSLCDFPRLPQNIPTEQNTSEGQEGFVNVSSLFIADP
jgi:hypothetical protein